MTEVSHPRNHAGMSVAHNALCVCATEVSGFLEEVAGCKYTFGMWNSISGLVPIVTSNGFKTRRGVFVCTVKEDWIKSLKNVDDWSGGDWSSDTWESIYLSHKTRYLYVQGLYRPDPTIHGKLKLIRIGRLTKCTIRNRSGHRLPCVSREVSWRYMHAPITTNAKFYIGVRLSWEGPDDGSRQDPPSITAIQKTHAHTYETNNLKTEAIQTIDPFSQNFESSLLAFMEQARMCGT